MSLRDYINPTNTGFNFPLIGTKSLSFYNNIDLIGAGTSIQHSPSSLVVNPIPKSVQSTKLEYNTATHNITYSPTAYGDFINTNTIAISANTATPIEYSNSEIELNVKIDNTFPSHIVVSENGVYKMGTSIQFQKGGGGEVEVDLWFRKQGVDIQHSASAITLTGGAGSKEFAYVEIIENLTAGQYMEVIIGTTDATISAVAQIAQAVPFPRPSIPSIITTIYKLN
jgi:hypothetical protein